MSYIVLRGRWCNIILLNVYAQGGEKVMIEKIVLREIRAGFLSLSSVPYKTSVRRS